LVWSYVVRLMIGRNQDLEGEIKNLLLESSRAFQFGMLLCTVAALDHILIAAVANETEREETLKAMALEDPSMQILALRDELNARHFQNALAAWTELRSGPLTPEMIRDFERRLRTTPYKK
jgi:hypothetical protein